MKRLLIETITVALTYTLMGAAYILTFIIDPDPEKTTSEATSDPYWIREVKTALRKYKSNG